MTALLFGSMLALALAPVLMPDSFSWVANTTSESAAQGLPGAWLARAGFVLFGLGVIWLAFLVKPCWGRWGVVLHSTFGVLMLATAVFSHAPIESGVSVDSLEDALHSVAATLMGFAFAGGVFIVSLRRRPDPIKPLDALAVVASVAIPLAMVWRPDGAGLLQRLMFLIAYAWYLSEAWKAWSGPVRTAG